MNASTDNGSNDDGSKSKGNDAVYDANDGPDQAVVIMTGRVGMMMTVIALPSS